MPSYSTYYNPKCASENWLQTTTNFSTKCSKNQKLFKIIVIIRSSMQNAFKLIRLQFGLLKIVAIKHLKVDKK